MASRFTDAIAFDELQICSEFYDFGIFKGKSV